MLTKCNNDFEQGMIRGQCYLEGHLLPNNSAIEKPYNMGEIIYAMKKEPSPLLASSLSTQSFERFKELNATSSNNAAEKFIIPFLTGHRRQSCCMSPFNRCIFRPALDGYIYLPTLDLDSGSKHELVNQAILKEYRPLLSPRRFQDLFIAPNLILEVASPRESMRTLMRGACYHGSLAAEFIIKLRMLSMSDSLGDGNAYSFTSTFHNGTLKIFTTCIIGSRDRSSPGGFHTTLLGTWAMTDSIRGYQEAVICLRNISAFANAKRALFIESANKNQVYI